MPALMTHHLFGEESVERLPEGLVSSAGERAAFLLANQGPDPFFFHVRTPHMAACMELAQRMHRSRMSRQMAALYDGVAHLPKHDAAVGRAFVLGLISHYILDRTAHPFVYAQQEGIQQADPTLADAGSEVHAIIEGDLDVLMVQRKREGATCADYPPADELVTTERINRVAGALMSAMAYQVYGLPVGANEYGGAVADMQLVYRLIEPAGSRHTRAIEAAETLVRHRSMLEALAHRVTATPPAGAGNLACHRWRDPFTGRASTASFPALFEHALDVYGAAARRFVATGDAVALTEHINYAGRHLGADEECDED